MAGSSPTCARCGDHTHAVFVWKDLGLLEEGEWAQVCTKKGFLADAYKEEELSGEDAGHTWIALCLDCWNYKVDSLHIIMDSGEQILSSASPHSRPRLSAEHAYHEQIPLRFQNPFTPGYFLQESPLCSPVSELANAADACASGPLSQALPQEILVPSGTHDDEQMTLAVRAYHESMYARQHQMWAKFLLQRWWNWVYRTSDWWLRCNEREAQREWIYY